jgi:acetyl esterase/lipase
VEVRGGIGALAAALALTICPAAAQAKKLVTGPYQEQYGPAAKDFYVVFQSGPPVVLLLHENGHDWTSLRGVANSLEGAGFTVLDMEWAAAPEKTGSRVWGPDTAQVEQAVRYTIAHASALGVDPTRIALMGGSAGANLALLTAPDMDAVEPGTIKAVVALSGDVDPVAELERADAAEAAGEAPNPKVVLKFARTYGCKGGLNACPMGYVEEWSPYQKILEMPGSSTPPMLLAASVDEEGQRVASWEDQVTMAQALEEKGVPAVVETPSSGHGFRYIAQVLKPIIAFLNEQDG